MLGLHKISALLLGSKIIDDAKNSGLHISPLSKISAFDMVSSLIYEVSHARHLNITFVDLWDF
jgi:hypothetical protein